MMRYGMMGDWFGSLGVSSWWMIGYGIVRLAIIVGVVILFIRLINKNKRPISNYNTSNRALEILKERYAAGDITEEEYNRKYKMLK